MRIGIVGLGVMGSATGAHLAAAGHDVCGYDIDPAACRHFEAVGTVVGDVPDLAARSEVVLTWLPDVAALEATTPGLAAGGRAGLVVVEMGTLPLDAKQTAADTLAARGIVMLDAPVSGTGRQAADATLVVYASGDPDAYRMVEPLFAVLGSSHHLGPFGHGSVMKYVANLLVTVHTAAAAEAHALAAASGIDPRLVQDVIAEGVGSSRMWEIRGQMMATATYQPPAGRLDIIKKDAGIISRYAAQVESPVPLLDLALEMFRDASAAGLGSLDAAAIRLHLDRR